jgi:hypothetical protein
VRKSVAEPASKAARLRLQVSRHSIDHPGAAPRQENKRIDGRHPVFQPVPKGLSNMRSSITTLGVATEPAFVVGSPIQS